MTLRSLLARSVLKYVFSGIIASAAMFVSLIFFREVLNIWYLYSSTIAFIVGFTSSFILQKFWTFGSNSGSDDYKQFSLFLIVSLANLGLNALGMFFLVDIVGVWYLMSQVIVTTCLAVLSFFAYRIIFRNKREQKTILQ